jgi:hypothetical protein
LILIQPNAAHHARAFARLPHRPQHQRRGSGEPADSNYRTILNSTPSPGSDCWGSSRITPRLSRARLCERRLQRLLGSLILSQVQSSPPQGRRARLLGVHRQALNATGHLCYLRLGRRFVLPETSKQPVPSRPLRCSVGMGSGDRLHNLCLQPCRNCGRPLQWHGLSRGPLRQQHSCSGSHGGLDRPCYHSVNHGCVPSYSR